GVRRTHARADVWERVRGVPRRRPALDTADDPMAVEMIGGPRLCEPLLATGLGRFTEPRAGTLTALGKEHLPIGEAVGFQAHRVIQRLCVQQVSRGLPA